MADYVQVTGVGNEGQGAGTAFGDINRDGTPDMVLMAYDNPGGANTFRYKIGWNVNFNTQAAASWTANYTVVPGVGNEGQGAGIALYDINRNGILDMVLMAYDNPVGANTFRYKIGWDLSTAGVAASWSTNMQISGLGSEAQGAGVSIGDIDRNGTPDFVFMAYDGSFRYKIGWNFGTNGIAASWSGSRTAGGVDKAEGADVVLADIDLNGKLDLVMMAYNDSEWNNFRYKVGWNLQTDGTTTNWSRYFVLKGVGMSGQGAGIAHYFHPTYGPKLAFMAYDNPNGANSFRYYMLPVTTSGACFGFADEKPAAPNNVLSVPTSWNNQNAQRLFNLNMSLVQDTADDALNLFLFYTLLVEIFQNTNRPTDALYSYPATDVPFIKPCTHANFDYSFEYFPDFLVAAVSWYVDNYMTWTSDSINSYVINNIFNLNYFAGAEGMPAYYTIRYTDPNRNPNLINQLNATNSNWGQSYNDGRLYHGDCEDHAILRHALLRSLGFNANFIWDAYSPGHEFNVVLYKGSYRIMDYGHINRYLDGPSGITYGLNGIWNTYNGPRTSGNTKTWLLNLLDRIYPDRPDGVLGYLPNRRVRPDTLSR
jgi:hypothetical protein